MIEIEFKLDDSLGFILNRTNTKLKNEMFQRFKEYDITPEQWSVLNCLWVQDGATPKELADNIYKDKPNTNRILEKLQKKVLIIRKPHPVDKRAFQIFLTDRGWALREELIPIVMKLLEEATIGIERNKVTEMKKMLNQIFDNLK
ncbi:MAG: ohrR 2 [Anaerosolibacter sp.]|uniref:MarR family winged helix-turn-helix transcriptional regulator n=1 Tax=Anaerosolibacter sp. TaxID=1872527 RepID=UPI002A3A6533|nr:ohrR 2 [Anaerosolibacter sp.]